MKNRMILYAITAYFIFFYLYAYTMEMEMPTQHNITEYHTVATKNICMRSIFDQTKKTLDWWHSSPTALNNCMINLISEIQKLTTAKLITPLEASAFAYTQTIESSFFKDNSIDQYIVCMTLERIASYLTVLKKLDKKSPTHEQYQSYITYISQAKSCNTLLAQLSACNIFVDEQAIIGQEAPIPNIPKDVDTDEFQKLINDIRSICELPLKKESARIVYTDIVARLSKSKETEEKKSDTKISSQTQDVGS